jgi:pimeloyl-ACP methyl ester carboxylesterase
MLLCLLVLAGCGGSKHTMPNPLHVTTTASFAQGPILVRHITYTTFDGERVPALFSIPRAVPPRGCVIWENGFRVMKEATAQFWPGAARLGLAIFAIDLRNQGQRSKGPGGLAREAHNPALAAGVIRGTVKDLQTAVDYLWSQPVCRRNIGYVGSSLGGIIGSIFAAQDQRVRAVVLMSVPPSLEALTTTDPFLAGVRGDPAELTKATRLLSPLNPDRWIGRISPRPLLLLFGTHDPIVPPRLSRLTAAAAGQPKKVVYYDGGHVPYVGAPAAGNLEKMGLFFLKHLVEPTYRGLGPVITPGSP